MSILKVDHLCKRYPAFELKDISFELEEGKITGFIGRNGAGKTTTLKSILNFVHPDSGDMTYFGMNLNSNEYAIKQKIGFVSGGINYYPKIKIRTITETTRRFYENWDDGTYRDYLKMFELDENKTPSQLSEGMKVKYSLALALSHNAKLLILDEPTSGLDPVSRDDLLDVFLALSQRGITILFSTHITSDLDKCADNIIYIRNGKIAAKDELKHFLAGYRTAELTEEQLTQDVKAQLIGCKKSKYGYSALVDAVKWNRNDIVTTEADLESIMIHFEKEESTGRDSNE